MKLTKLFGKSSRTGLPLALEITIFLIIKLCALWVLWKLFFSQPQTKKMQLPVHQVEQHFIERKPITATTAPIETTAPTVSANKKSNITPQVTPTESTSP